MIRFSSLTHRLVPVLLAATVLAAGAARAQTAIPFASGHGNFSTQTGTVGITPSAGTQQFLLTTINPAGSVPAGYGTGPADTDVTALNTYFGLANGTLAGLNAADGSGYLSSRVTLTMGSVVSFDYVFLTDEDNTLSGSQFHDDRAFLTINGVVNSTIYLASQLSGAQLDNGSNTIFSFQTPGYVTVNYTVPSTGDYTFGFGVIDTNVNTTKSGLLIDNFNYTVPEPGTAATVLLFVSSVVALGLARRFRPAASPIPL